MQELLTLPQWIPLFIDVYHVLVHRQIEMPNSNLEIKVLKLFFNLDVLASVVEFYNLSN
jgi:hypothetical protein